LVPTNTKSRIREHAGTNEQLAEAASVLMPDLLVTLRGTQAPAGQVLAATLDEDVGVIVGAADAA